MLSKYGTEFSHLLTKNFIFAVNGIALKFVNVRRVSGAGKRQKKVFEADKKALQCKSITKGFFITTLTIGRRTRQ